GSLPCALVVCRTGIVQRVADLIRGFADAGEDDAVAAYTDAPEMIEFATRDDVEAAAATGELAQNREVAVGFDGKANGVGQLAQAFVEFVIGAADRGPAIEIKGRRELARGFREIDVFAKDALHPVFAWHFAPGKVRGEFRGINELQFLSRSRG